MRCIPALCCATLVLGSFQPAAAEPEFDPAYEALVLVNLTVPARVATPVRMQLASLEAFAGSLEIPARVRFDELGSGALAGRSPRWASFTLEPAVLDSLVLRWQTIEVEVDRAPTTVEVDPAGTVIPLGRRLSAGEVAVLDLVWEPDALAADAADWMPVFRLEELAEPPAGARVYLSEEGTGVVAVHERRDGRMVRAFATGGRPRDLAWDRLRQRLYVAVAGRDELVVVDPDGQETVRRLPLSFGADPTRVVLTSDARFVAVLAPGRDMVFLFSTSSLQEIARIGVGQGPVALAEDPRTGRIFVSCSIAGRVDAIDPEAGRVVGRFGSFESPSEIAVLESGALAVGHSPGRRIDLVDPNTGTIQGTIEVCGPTDGLVEVPRAGRLFAVSNFCSEVTILRPEAGLEIGAIPLRETVGLPSVGPRGSRLYLPLPDADAVLLVAVDRPADQLRLETGTRPWRVLAP